MNDTKGRFLTLKTASTETLTRQGPSTPRYRPFVRYRLQDLQVSYSNTQEVYIFFSKNNLTPRIFDEVLWQEYMSNTCGTHINRSVCECMMKSSNLTISWTTSQVVIDLSETTHKSNLLSFTGNFVPSQEDASTPRQRRGERRNINQLTQLTRPFPNWYVWFVL